MKEKIIARLFRLQKRLQAIKNYSQDNLSALFKYSIEFELLLNNLLHIHHQKFYAIAAGYNTGTQITCRLGCEFSDKSNKQKAFYAGLNELYTCVENCINLLIM